MRRHTCFVLVFLIATFPVYISGYASGNVGGSCDSMLPDHTPNTKQTTDAPYQIITSSSSFKPRDTIQVTLRGTTGNNFRGFLLEARAAGPSSPGTPLGTFQTTTSDTQLLNCVISGETYMASAVSHNSGSQKLEIVVNWIAPDTGNIEFRATFVQSFTTFWTPVMSQIIKRSAAASVSPTTSNNSNTVTSGSSAMISLLNPATPPQGISNDGCGSTKFCFSSPAQCDPARVENCFFMSSTPLDNRGLQFEMSGRSTGYISIGFSDDRLMGNDDIYICGMDTSGNIQVQRAYSTGRVRPRTVPLGEVNNIQVADVNGIIQCSFNTRNNISTTQRAANEMYYLMFAYGPSANGQINQHIEIPFISEEKVNVGIIQLASGNRRKSTLIKTHAALLLIAWMTTGSIGMIVAKFFKNIGGSKKILGKNIWFQLHLLLMVLTVVATVIGFVLAFVHVRGWSHNKGVHPVLGCIVMGLALIQPTVAICRPSPDNKRRFIFNWFHSLLALVIKCLAVATLFLGFILLLNRTANKWPVKVLGGFVGWEALLFTLLFICCYFKEKAVYVNLKKKVDPDFILFIVYLCGNLAFVIALLVGIAQT
ncbi:putative ferric-chelate reductase 1 isoform X2 [Scyliorhinus canicula]|nr:putative ferric-chelate reductase 1 isoform X2 [Scyliorhinus canicula]